MLIIKIVKIVDRKLYKGITTPVLKTRMNELENDRHSSKGERSFGRPETN